MNLRGFVLATRPRRYLAAAALAVLIVSGTALGQRLWGLYQWHAVQTQWHGWVDEAAQSQTSQLAQALVPLDEYFDQHAFPNIGQFLDEFTGPIDTARFVYKWTADKIGFRSYSDRVTNLTKSALAAHLGFPEKLNRAIGESIQRFEVLQAQTDAGLREKSYTLLHGAGVAVDAEKAKHLQEQGLAEARRLATEDFCRDSTSRFAGLVAAKEVAMVALQSMILERVMVAVGTRMGVVTAGAGAATATSAAGTATGPGAPAAYTLAAAEIIVAVVIDMAVSHWLESRAEKRMRDDLLVIREELKAKIRQFLSSYAQQANQERLALLGKIREG